MPSRFIEFLRGEASLLLCSIMGIGTLLLLNPKLPARYPDLRGDSGRALWVAFSCTALMILWRTLSGRKGEGFSSLGANRRELIREAGISLVFQVALPLILLAAVCHQRVAALFAIHGGMPEAAVVVLVCAVAIFLLLHKAKGERSRMSLLRGVFRAFPYLSVRAGLTEETLFRGCMQTAAVQQLGVIRGMTLTIVIFSVAHVYQVFRLKKAGIIERIPWGAVALSLSLKQIPCTLLFSLLWHSSGNLWSCILLHGWINACYLGQSYEQAAKNRSEH